MVAIAILSVIIMVAPRLMQDTTRFSKLSTARLETVRDARDSLGFINKTLRQANASTINVTQKSGQAPYSAVAFTTTDGRSMEFYQQNKTLYSVQDGSTQTLSTNLRFISFSYPRTDDPNIISVSVTMEKGTFEERTKALQMAIEKVRVMN